MNKQILETHEKQGGLYFKHKDTVIFVECPYALPMAEYLSKEAYIEPVDNFPRNPQKMVK